MQEKIKEILQKSVHLYNLDYEDISTILKAIKLPNVDKKLIVQARTKIATIIREINLQSPKNNPLTKTRIFGHDTTKHKENYRSLSLLLHPDKLEGLNSYQKQQCEEAFKIISDIYKDENKETEFGVYDFYASYNTTFSYRAKEQDFLKGIAFSFGTFTVLSFSLAGFCAGTLHWFSFSQALSVEEIGTYIQGGNLMMGLGYATSAICLAISAYRLFAEKEDITGGVCFSIGTLTSFLGSAGLAYRLRGLETLAPTIPMEEALAIIPGVKIATGILLFFGIFSTICMNSHML